MRRELGQFVSKLGEADGFDAIANRVALRSGVRDERLVWTNVFQSHVQSLAHTWGSATLNVYRPEPVTGQFENQVDFDACSRPIEAGLRVIGCCPNECLQTS